MQIWVQEIPEVCDLPVAPRTLCRSVGFVPLHNYSALAAARCVCLNLPFPCFLTFTGPTVCWAGGKDRRKSLAG